MIRNHILFQFVDSVDGRGRFKKETSIIEVPYGDFEDSAKAPRWGVVVAAGPDVDDQCSAPGTLILIDNLKWTLGFDLDGKKYWRTDDRCVLGVTE